ncbi:Cytochrome c oxidase subunit 5C [Camellia lanceoleosa]|uniref:Cytochrome c oxidase subunit 5C n=1 Tax=Camellia lanceoleosa TaxID=1840588 RepID=A0ACC0I8U2_9ERIC|nr:Cytochrome c oxidase subunit 5C [Camellia lanceoleosa]
MIEGFVVSSGWLPSSGAGKSFLQAFSLVEDEIDLEVEIEPKAVAESGVGGVIVKHWWDCFFTTRVKMAGYYVTLKGPGVIKEICLGIIISLSVASMWKKKQWDMKKRTTGFYDSLNKGEISLVPQE